MANAITTVTKYLPLLDEVYKMGSLSAVLDTPEAFIRETEDAGTVMIAKTSMVGLGDYSRSTGFKAGDVTLTWESHSLQYDRGRSFQVDAMDDLESLGLAFGTLAGEFVRTQVVPEVDAIRFAKYATGAGKKATGSLTTGKAVDEALQKAEVEMEEAEVTLAGAQLFMTPTIYGLLKTSEHFQRSLTPSENPNRNFGSYDEIPVTRVPQTRFYSAVTTNAGATSSAGGFAKASGAADINFLLIHPSAVIQLVKHGKIRVFDPDTNQSADAWKIDYRIYHDAWVLENKTEGIYAHTKASS